jgi:glycosyltransferase 2 family protein
MGMSRVERTGRRPRAGGANKLALLAAKLIVTGTCFWYVSRQIDWNQVLSAIPWLDFRWAAFATLVVILQIPLVAMRWCKILNALRARNARMTIRAILAVTAIGVFFAQVLPTMAGEGVRAWLLARLGSDWRNAVTSVVIDGGVGAGLLIAAGFVILLLPSGLTALGEYRHVVLVVYGALLLAGVSSLLWAPTLLLSRYRFSSWFATLIVDARRVLFGRKGPIILGIACLVPALNVVVVWSLGRAQGLLLPVPDAAVLFTVIVGVTLLPISISGWGLRELAVISLLGHHGIAAERALLFSVSFGLIHAIGSLPGAVAWLVYSFAPARHWREEAGDIDEAALAGRVDDFDLDQMRRWR